MSDATDSGPKCPVCGETMRQTRKGATLKKRGPAWICPRNEGEVFTDWAGRKRRWLGSVHKALTVYQEQDLANE